MHGDQDSKNYKFLDLGDYKLNLCPSPLGHSLYFAPTYVVVSMSVGIGTLAVYSQILFFAQLEAVRSCAIFFFIKRPL